MKFTPAPISGGFVIEATASLDERGSFSRVWCEAEFNEHRINSGIAQISISVNTVAGTLRGLHFQSEPASETKLVRCIRGSIFDVMVDLRPESPTFKKWHAEVLSAENGKALFIPPGCAHGFQTLEDDSHVLYLITPDYRADCARVIRWDDPTFAVQWPPCERRIISQRDMAAPLFQASL